MKITKSQLAEAIKKEVSRLHKINIMETRLKDLNRELRLLKEGSILLKEDYDADSIASEIDDWVESYSDSLADYNLKNKIEELLGDDFTVTVQKEVEEDAEGRSYGENWDKTLITIKIDGKDLMKVWVNARGSYDFGKNSTAFAGLPKDKIVSAPYGGGARFYFDKSALNKADNAPSDTIDSSTSFSSADGQGEERKKRPRINRPGLMEGDEVEKISLEEFKDRLGDYISDNPDHFALEYKIPELLFGEDYTDEDEDRVSSKREFSGRDLVHIAELDGKVLVKVLCDGLVYDSDVNQSAFGDYFFVDENVFNQNYANN
jgi:hypothetical protein